MICGQRWANSPRAGSMLVNGVGSSTGSGDRKDSRRLRSKQDAAVAQPRTSTADAARVANHQWRAAWQVYANQFPARKEPQGFAVWGPEGGRGALGSGSSRAAPLSSVRTHSPLLPADSRQRRPPFFHPAVARSRQCSLQDENLPSSGGLTPYWSPNEAAQWGRPGRSVRSPSRPRCRRRGSPPRSESSGGGHSRPWAPALVRSPRERGSSGRRVVLEAEVRVFWRVTAFRMRLSGVGVGSGPVRVPGWRRSHLPRSGLQTPAPLSISYSTQPKLKMSLRASACLPWNCSGDMYCKVPRIWPSAVRAWSRSSVSERRGLFARPKSSSLIPCFVTRIWRFQIAMRDAFGARRRERRGFARRIRLLFDWQRAFERGAFDEFHHHVIRADVVELADCGWLNAATARASCLKRSENCALRDFDGDDAVEAGVAGFVDFAHAACAEGERIS